MTWTVIVLLSALASLCGASAPDCGDLIQPFIPDDQELIFGKWVYVMGAGDPMPYHQAMGSIKSSWIELSPTSTDHTVTLRWGDCYFNRCVYGHDNATVTDTTIAFRKNLSLHNGQILKTCHDCLLWSGSFQNLDVTGRFILHFTRSGTIDPKDVEVFKKQVNCQNFPENFHSYDGKTELCPDDKQRTE
ncbi:uncharacterized protein LOC144195728 [Stigmatopora nigra]